MARSKGVVVQISAEDNTARAFESVQGQVAALRQQVATLRSQLSGGGPGEDLARGMGHAVPEVAAASAAIREFEGNLPVRAIERFLTTTLGLGPVLSAAFPVFGAIALGGAIYEGVSKLLAMRDAAAKMGQTINEAFGSAIAKEREHADALAVTNDKLENEIAKLEHKPGNGLMLAADEAREAIDKLDGSIRSATADATALFNEKTKVGFFDRLTGTKDNAPVKDEVTSTMQKVDATRGEYSSVINQAQDDGRSPENIEALKQAELGKIQGIYAESTKRLRAMLKDAQDKQYDSKRLGGDGKDYDPLINSIQGSLGLYDQQQRAIGQQYRNTVDEPAAAKARVDHANDENAKRAEEQARKEREAADKLSAARTQLDQAETKREEAAAKSRSASALAILEDSHRELQTSDEDYYRQKADIQADALASEKAALIAQQNEIQGQADRLSGQKLTGTDATERDAKVLGLKAKIVDLDEKSAKLTGDQAANTAKLAEELDGLTRKRLADADAVAARLEQQRGGSTSARSKQSSDEYARRRQQAVVSGADDSTLAAMDAEQGLGQDAIVARGADESYGLQAASISAGRSNVSSAESRGGVGALAAQQQRIALDREEAQALQPVLAAYEKLAADGDLAAAEKVVSLREKIAELNDPINEVAASVRNQLDASFEGLFINIGKGEKAWKQFANSLQADLSKDVYKQLIEPGIQAGLGSLIPNSRGGSGVPNASQGGAASALGGLFGKVMGIPTGGAAAKGTAGAPVVNIINQSSQPVQGSATSQDGSGLTEQLRGPVLEIMLQDLERGGSFAQALIGGGLLAG